MLRIQTLVGTDGNHGAQIAASLFSIFQDKRMKQKECFYHQIDIATSVTRLGDLLDFGQVLKPLTTINLPKSPTLLCNFLKVAKIFNFYSTIIFWQLFIDIWRFFSGHTERNFN